MLKVRSVASASDYSLKQMVTLSQREAWVPQCAVEGQGTAAERGTQDVCRMALPQTTASSPPSSVFLPMKRWDSHPQHYMGAGLQMGSPSSTLHGSKVIANQAKSSSTHTEALET